MGESHTEHLKILVVEDNEDVRLTLRLAVESRGYRVIEASDGEQAVSIASVERPDVILMDLSLPVIDGLTATRLIRENALTANAIIIAVTAHIEADYRTKALAAGCNAYVTKPIDFNWLNDLIGNLLS